MYIGKALCYTINFFCYVEMVKLVIQAVEKSRRIKQCFILIIFREIKSVNFNILRHLCLQFGLKETKNQDFLKEYFPLVSGGAAHYDGGEGG